MRSAAEPGQPAAPPAGALVRATLGDRILGSPLCSVLHNPLCRLGSPLCNRGHVLLKPLNTDGGRLRSPLGRLVRTPLNRSRRRLNRTDVDERRTEYPASGLERQAVPKQR